MYTKREWCTEQLISVRKLGRHYANFKKNGIKVPAYPKLLPGEIWGVVSHFNPAGYKGRTDAFNKFAQNIRRQGLKLLVVELIYSGRKNEINQDSCDHVIRIETDQVLWQKERLLNIAISNLPASCDKVVWLDEDVIFENDNWVKETSANLEIFNVVQPYQIAHWLRQDEEIISKRLSSYGNREGQRMLGAAYNISLGGNIRANRYTSIGHCGFAWAIRKEILDNCNGLYDRQILGGADLTITRAMYGALDVYATSDEYRYQITKQMRKDIIEWSSIFFNEVMSSVGFTRGKILHLWHGNRQNRIKLHAERQKKLVQFGFNPYRHIVLDDNDCWRWNGADPNLIKWTEEYFHARKEA